jgi:hypothetical protein
MSTVLPHIPSSRAAHRYQASRSRPRRMSTTYLGILREVGIVSLAIVLYFFVRGLMDSKFALAAEHAQWLVGLEQRLGIFHEPDIQRWVMEHGWLVWLVNAIYMYGHWPVLIATMVWLLWKRREQFPVYRSALLISGAIGLVAFVTFPMAPPRFLPELGFVDTVTVHSDAYRVLQPPAFTNQYAAMPSLHVGWNLLMGIALFRTIHHRFWQLLAVIMPLAMYLATILTANHFILDGVIGSLVALIGLTIAMRISAPVSRRDAAPATIGFPGQQRMEAA